MFKRLFGSARSVKVQLVHLDETDEWTNIDDSRTIEVVVYDHVATNAFTTQIAPHEKIGLQEGMEIRYARFVT